jgi:hypothetical protein
MKEVPAVHLQLAAAEPPVRPQQEMKSENSMVVIVQHSIADQAKVGKVFFPLARIGPPAVAAPAGFQGNRASVRPFSDELPKTVETGPKNRPKYAIARRFLSVMDKAHAEALAVRARRLCQPYRVRSAPLHDENVLLWRQPLRKGAASTAFSNLAPHKKTSSIFIRIFLKY